MKIYKVFFPDFSIVEENGKKKKISAVDLLRDACQKEQYNSFMLQFLYDLLNPAYTDCKSDLVAVLGSSLAKEVCGHDPSVFAFHASNGNFLICMPPDLGGYRGWREEYTIKIEIPRGDFPGEISTQNKSAGEGLKRHFSEYLEASDVARLLR